MKIHHNLVYLFFNVTASIAAMMIYDNLLEMISLSTNLLILIILGLLDYREWLKNKILIQQFLLLINTLLIFTAEFDLSFVISEVLFQSFSQLMYAEEQLLSIQLTCFIMKLCYINYRIQELYNDFSYVGMIRGISCIFCLIIALLKMIKEKERHYQNTYFQSQRTIFSSLPTEKNIYIKPDLCDYFKLIFDKNLKIIHQQDDQLFIQNHKIHLSQLLQTQIFILNNISQIKQAHLSSMKQQTLLEFLMEIKNQPLQYSLIYFGGELINFISIITKEQDNLILTFYNLKVRDSKLEDMYLKSILDQILHTVSHEFGTILNYMQAYVKKRQVQIIQSCQQMHYLILSLVDYGDLLGSNFKLEIKQLDNRKILQDLKNMFQQNLRAKGLNFITNIQECTEQCYSDPNRIKQILIHLISNAQKFTYKGSITVSVLEERYSIRFEVIDTGIGIAEQDDNQLKEIFQQSHRDGYRLTGNTAGFGIGCYLSNQLALYLSDKDYMEGGGLQFKKNEEGGTIFWFTVKNYKLNSAVFQNQETIIKSISRHAYVDKRTTSFNQLSSPSKQRKSPKIVSLEPESPEEINIIMHEPSNPKVLIVDDEMINIIALRALLNQYKIECDFAFNGEEALGKMNKKEYKAIFLDLNMPIMNGFEMMKHISDHNRLNIIACTAFSDEKTKRQCLESGMKYYLNKPVDISELEKILEEIIQ